MNRITPPSGLSSSETFTTALSAPRHARRSSSVRSSRTVCGTDCIHLWERGGRGEDCIRGEVGGRLLVDRDGTTCAADYASLGRQLLSGGAVLSFFPEEAAEIVGEFSPDRQGRRMRGYVSYALTVPEGRNVSEWYNYTHQISPFLYPRTTALSRQRPSSAWVGNRTFRSFYSALQFTP